MGFNTKRTLWVGFGFMSICAFWQIYDGIVPLILRDTFGLDGAGKGLVMAADNILALVLLPLFGSLSDRTPYPPGPADAVHPGGHRPGRWCPCCLSLWRTT